MIEYATTTGIFCADASELGFDAMRKRLARALDDHDVRATFLACAVAIERNPEVGADIRERRHEPCFHGWRWEEAFRLTREEEREAPAGRGP